jgi:hypothetical protein
MEGDFGRDKQSGPIFDEFNPKSFDPDQEAQAKCKGVGREEIIQKARRCETSRTIINEKIVQILEKNSRLFITLSQCISNFEREFTEYPPKIVELQKLVAEAAKFPVPSFDEAPSIPVSPNHAIIGKPAWIVNAPLRYDCLVQQHRVPESIQLVVDCLKSSDRIPSIDEWVNKTRAHLHTMIQGNLKALHLNSDDAKQEFRQLQALGYEPEAVHLFVKLANKTLDAKLEALPNTGQFLQCVRHASVTLCNELSEMSKTFLELFPQHYLAELVSWVSRSLETKLPIANPKSFANNFNLVKDALRIMNEAVTPLESLGVNARHIFESTSGRYVELLEMAAHQHILEVTEAVRKEKWELNLANISELKVEEYEACPALKEFQSHVTRFAAEMKYLYEAVIFHDCVRLYKDVLLCFGLECLAFLEEEPPSINTFCDVAVQLVCCSDLLIPGALAEFEKVTGRPYPGEAQTLAEATSALNDVLAMIGQTFIGMWADRLMHTPFVWDGIDQLVPQFAEAVQVMRDFLEMLELPDVLYTRTTDGLVNGIVAVAEATSQFVDAQEGDEDGNGEVTLVDSMNSFSFHWVFFAQRVGELFSKSANTKLLDGIVALGNRVAGDLSIREGERLPMAALAEKVNQAIADCQQEEED